MNDAHWCNTCRKRHDNFEVLKTEQGKKGKYHPYRDTMEAEPYTFTEITKKCNVCGEEIKVERDEVYHRGKSRMEENGYRNSHYGT